MASRPQSYADSKDDSVLHNHQTSTTHLPHDNLEHPRASFLADEGSNANTYATNSANNSGPLLGVPAMAVKGEPDTQGAEDAAPKNSRSRRKLFVLGGLLALAIIAGIVLGIVFGVVKKNKNNGSGGGGSASSGGSGGSGSSGTKGAISGGDGSRITTDDGSTFTYKNQFGGHWYSDPNDPFNNNARPNSWTPPLNTSWTWGKDKIYGVNLGGLFVLEPFITPSLFDKYPGAIDEWSFSTLMAADTANGGLKQLEEHYKTFITEQDIAEIAGAGLNWVRIPIPYWAIDTWSGEPFLAKVSWKYILRVFKWCRKYGLRVNLDLHTAPGSQNGYNHSGLFGVVNFLNGVMGIANSQRLLNYIRIITEFISQPEYQNLIPLFGIINEALLTTIGKDQLTSFYLEAHDMIRNITGTGAGNGAYIAIHDGFQGTASWAGFLPESDRVILDTHPYFAFDNLPNNDNIATGTGAAAGGPWPKRACDAWAEDVSNSQTGFGVTVAGEFSSGYNDCGVYLRGIPSVTSYGGDCSFWQDASKWDDATKAGVKAFTMASMDALQNWFFWTWKIGNNTNTNVVGSPLWSYQLGLEQGWIPTDPRTADGMCKQLGTAGTTFDGTYLPWQTGGAGAGQIAPAIRAQYPWPPAVVSGVGGAPVNVLPTYTPTGTVATLPPAQLTPSPTRKVSMGNGWADASDTALGPTEIPGCVYPNAWSAQNAAIPTVFCGPGVLPNVGTTSSSTTTTTRTTTTNPATTTTALTGVATTGVVTTGVATTDPAIAVPGVAAATTTPALAVPVRK